MPFRGVAPHSARTLDRPQPTGGRTLIALLIALISLGYILVSLARGQAMSGAGTYDMYAELTRSFLHGKLSLPIEPSSELLSLPNPYDARLNFNYRVHDASLYQGHYYVYFGVVPVVTLFLPYRVVSGHDLPQRVAVPIFCIAGFLSSCGLLFLLAEHNRWVIPFWMQCAAVVSLGSGSLVSLLLRSPSFYQVAIASGYFFVMTGFLVLARATFVDGAGARWFLLAGLLFGAAVGCRPNLIVLCGAVLGVLAIRFRRNLRRILPLATGMAICAVLLGAYNYARFDDPLEFGRTYQLTEFSITPGSTHYGMEFNARTMWLAAVKYLFLPPLVEAQLPFFHTVPVNPLMARSTPYWMEKMVGLVPVAPIAFLGLIAPLFLVRRAPTCRFLDEASRWLLYAMYISGLAVLSVLCVAGWLFDRYIVDFASLLVFQGTATALVLWQTISKQPAKYAFGTLLGLAAGYGAVVNLAFATPALPRILKFLGAG